MNKTEQAFLDGFIKAAGLVQYIEAINKKPFGQDLSHLSYSDRAKKLSNEQYKINHTAQPGVHPSIAKLLNDQLGVNYDQIGLDRNLSKHLGAGDLDRVELCMALEEMSGVEMPDSFKFNTVKDYQDFALKHKAVK